ncbi:uncharacterized protein LOC128983120 [Macrosteles quadrilineatus]|uniref:uncharacterized protein LOC128983120 n=1 Tax=Macrosteles quadrilineatus TaxID=74068 RepID=UPI0023E1FBFF|nr:uncharacterized protein LOC128983120 [Macrosteles quadrilineatus]
MESAPDPSLTNSPNINSVLKPPKPRIPLKDLMAAAPEEDNTAARKRRVSFANVNKIKEFSAGAESMVVCQTPAYEEPFSVSSDSSYPSGVDGWTPGKVQSSVEKENMSIPTLRMSTEMDLTRLVENPACRTRFSVNEMDLTEVANSCRSANFDQQTRFSLGMDLTNVATGYSNQNTKYSVGDMDSSEMARSHRVLDQTNGHSTGMDMIGRYSINGMDLTEAANLHQTLPNRRSARFSVAMDFTNVIGNPMSTIRFSCNEMELTEAARPFTFSEQPSKDEHSVNASLNGSEELELTEAVEGAQFSAVSPKYKSIDVGLTENVLYSVNNTRYSVNNMDMTSAVASGMSTNRRKSSRYSLVNMDLTEIVDNSSDALELTQTIGDPQIKSGLTKNSVCEMDLAESVDQGFPEISNRMDHQTSDSIKLEYSVDSTNLMNLTKPIHNAPEFNEEDLIPTPSFKADDTCSSFLSGEDLKNVDEKLSDTRFCSTSTSQSSTTTTTDVPVVNENEQNNPHNTIHVTKHSHQTTKLNDSSNKSSSNSEGQLKKDLLGSELNVSLVEKVYPSAKTVDREENLKEILDSSKHEKNLLKMVEKTFTDSETELNENKLCLLNVDNCYSEDDKSSSYLKKECEQENIIIIMSGSNHYSNIEGGTSEQKTRSCATYQKDLIFENESNNKDPISNETMIIDDALNTSITNSTDIIEIKANEVEHSCLDGETIPETMTEGSCCLNESVMNMSLGNTSVDQVQEFENCNEQVKGIDVIIEPPFSFPLSNLDEEDSQKISTIHKDQSADSKMSPNSSLNLSNRSVFCNKNITMTRGSSKSSVITSNTSLEISCKDTSIELKSNSNCKILNQSESNISHGVVSQHPEAVSGCRGKRSFEAALEPENDTEESPVKQLCMSREERSTEYEILNNITVPSFLMDTVSAQNETDTCLDHNETPEAQHHIDSTAHIHTESALSTQQNKQGFSLLINSSFKCNMSENLLRHEVIDLCESSFDATTTEVRDLMNNSRYKTTNVTNNEEVACKQQDNSDCVVRKCDSSGFHELDNKHFDQGPQSELIKEELDSGNLNTEDTLKTELGREKESWSLEPLNLPTDIQSSICFRKWGKLKIVRKNTFTACFIPNWIEILFTVDSWGNVVNVSYQSICTGGNTAITEYLLKQARNYVFPKKGSDLIMNLISEKKSHLARLARNVNLICKYHNGKINGDILTLEAASCKHHFWTFIDVNIKHPQSLNETDITISEQKIGELKLSYIRRIFKCIEENEDQLLNFAKAVSKMQRSDYQF